MKIHRNGPKFVRAVISCFPKPWNDRILMVACDQLLWSDYSGTNGEEKPTTGAKNNSSTRY